MVDNDQKHSFKKLLESFFLLLLLLNIPTSKANKEITHDTIVSYVIEPFDTLDFVSFASNEVDGSTTDLSIFGRHAMEAIMKEESGNIRHVTYRPYNCFGADHFFLWFQASTIYGQGSLHLSFYDDTSCLVAQVPSNASNNTDSNPNKECRDSDALELHTVAEYQLKDATGDWQELKVDTSRFQSPDLRRIRGWQVDIANATIGDTILLDQLACVGGGRMLSSAFNLGPSQTYQDAVESSTWEEIYYKSEESEMLTEPSFENGQFHFNPYVVEQTENWGGFTSFTHLAPAAAYYNLSQADALIVDYFIDEIASVSDRVVFRIILQDTAECTEFCGDHQDVHEKWYSFHNVLDQAGSGRVIVPLIGSESPDTPFWLTGWSGVKGNALFDIAEIKGFTFELNINAGPNIGEVVSGSFDILDLKAGEISYLLEAEVSYVIEPFETIRSSWVLEPPNDLSLLDINISSEEALFGSHSLEIVYSQSSSFRWVMTGQAHNCFGALYISIWYKADEGSSFNLNLFDDSHCIASNPDDPTICGSKSINMPLDETITNTMDQWKEVRVSDLSGIDLRRITGWEVELVGNGHLWLDQLQCVGQGDLLGSSFVTGLSDWSDALTVGGWTESQDESTASNDLPLPDLSQEGELTLEYFLEPAESKTGYVALSYSTPGAGYFNLSHATNLILSFQVEEASSTPGYTFFQFKLTKSNDLASSEPWSSSHPILDEVGHGQLVLALGQEDNEKSTSMEQVNGYEFEIILESGIDVGSIVSGEISWFGLRAAVRPQSMVERNIIIEDGLLIDGPTFDRKQFLGSVCQEICIEDQDCLYGASIGKDCWIASSLTSQGIRLVNKAADLHLRKSFWTDDPAKRGEWCKKCVCDADLQTIDCTRQDLVIIPKVFEETWKPLKLDLRDNPRLLLLGSHSLDEVGESLEELWLSSTIRHIELAGLSELSNLQVFQIDPYGDDNDDDGGGGSELSNIITERNQTYSDVCCSIGSELMIGPDTLFYCDIRVSLPGIDSVYDPFIQYLDVSELLVLTSSSIFMSEAAESPEKCAEYCTINDECQYFGYDGRIPNAEPSCNLYKSKGENIERVCCEHDHYADEDETIPGWISGRPPQTRHHRDNAKVLYEPRTLIVNEENDFSTEYHVSLGSNPIRGAVWIEPKLVIDSSAEDVSGDDPLSQLGIEVIVTPDRVALYDEATISTITLQVKNVPRGLPSVTLIVQNTISSCDEAFMLITESQENTVYITVTAGDFEERSIVVVMAVVSFSVVVLVVIVAKSFVEHKRRQSDSIWKMKREELKFDEPAKILGRGAFGLVLLAEYRGTKVAVKRVLPPCLPNAKVGRGSFLQGSANESVANSDSRGGTYTAPEGSDRFDMDASEVSYASGYHSGHQPAKKNGRQSFLSNMTRGQNFAAQLRAMEKDFVKEMRYMSKLRHPCITTLMGAVVGNNTEPLLVMEYMDHGSLYDLLHNETLIIEGEILLPILQDITQGMRFLHAIDPPILHGDLKAQNILVDSRFRAKVSDFGLSQKQSLGGTGSPFWMAPEFLRKESENTTASDVYSFGIILYEVYARRDPYKGENMIEVLLDVADKTKCKRPPVPTNCPSHIQTLMKDCSRDEANRRPSFEELDILLSRVDIADVEQNKHTNNRATSISLFDIFPEHIARALKNGQKIEPEHRDVVTIFFSDIVGFTEISSKLPPRKIASMLDRLYTKLDSFSQKHDVFKVETIGDAYMAVTNLTKHQPDDHARRIAEFAMEAIQSANETLIDEDTPEKGFVSIRVGFHSGPVVADVVGTRNPRYCLFGATVNTASRMESNSKVNRIHCSSDSAGLLVDQFPGLPLKSRGEISIKGKGTMHTFWVNQNGGNDTVELKRIVKEAMLKNQLDAEAFISFDPKNNDVQARTIDASGGIQHLSSNTDSHTDLESVTVAQ